MPQSILQILFCIFLFSQNLLAAEEIRVKPFPGSEKLKIYVMLGMHVDFYHSWRGDTPDDAGYGLDIRVVRSSLNILNAANAQGKKAKAYWDFSASHWTLGDFVPNHAPDLIPLWQSRASQDEYVVGPYNNGANSAGTKEEFQKSIQWTLNNPGGYGLKQLFPHVTMMYRPQENMFASNQIPWAKEMGMEALILHYSTWPFTAFSNFIAPLADSDRFNPLWMRTVAGEDPIVVLPAMFPIDLVNEASLENLMVRLRKKQLSGEIRRNLVVHVNMDADAKSWMPMTNITFLQKLVPNLGGLQELIDVVNKFKWADFTTPKEYLKIEKPQKEILVGQDMADGAFDGFYSWAERSFTQKYWTRIENSRRYEMAMFATEPLLRSQYFNWGDEAFQNRVLALSTTHYGMSTPFVNQQRLTHLDQYTSKALSIRESQFKTAVAKKITHPLLTEIHLADFPRLGETSISSTAQLSSYPILVKKGLRPYFQDPSVSTSFLSSVDENNDLYRAYFLHGGKQSLSSYEILAAEPALPVMSENRLQNKWIQLVADTDGISSFQYQNQSFGSRDFLSPFLTFDMNKTMAQGQNSTGGKILRPEKYSLLTQKISPTLSSLKMSSYLDLQTKEKTYRANLNYEFLLHQDLPYLYLKMNSSLPNTMDEKLPEFATRKFLRHVDFRWREIALANIRPHLGAGDHYKVWKSNFTDKVNSFVLNYQDFNPKNKEFDSLNNHQTPGWVAFSRGGKGVLIATNTSLRSSMAFAPIRLHNENSDQILSINPFGSYHGKQLNYKHLGGENLGTLLANAGAPVVLPNAPTFNGENIEMDLMIAPYSGDAPPADLITAAKRFAFPPVATYTRAGNIFTEEEYQSEVSKLKSQALAKQLNLQKLPIIPPIALAAAPDDKGAIFTWHASTDPRVTRQEVVYRLKTSSDWQSLVVRDPASQYLEMKNLNNGDKYVFGVRAYNAQAASTITAWQTMAPTDKLDEPLSVRPTLEMVWKFLVLFFQYHSVQDPDP